MSADGGYRLRKLYRKNRAVVLTTTAFALVLLSATIVSLIFGVQANVSRNAEATQRRAAEDHAKTARTEWERAERTGNELRQTLYVTEMNLVRDAWEGNRIDFARELLKKQIPPSGTTDLRHFEWFYLNRLLNPDLRHWRLNRVNHDHQLSWSPDGSKIAVGGGEIREFATGKMALKVPQILPGERVLGNFVHMFTPDGRWLVLDESLAELTDRNANGGILHFVDPRTQEFKHRIPMPDGNGDPHWDLLTFSNDGTRMSLCRGNRSFVWDLSTWKIIRETDRDYYAILSPDGKLLARILEAKGPLNVDINQVQIWRIEPWEKVATFKVPAPPLTSYALLRFSPDGKQLAYVADETKFTSGVFGGRVSSAHWMGKRVCVCSVETGEPKWWLVCDHQDITALAWGADNFRFATGSADGIVRVWEPWSSVPTVFRGQTSRIISLAFSPDNRTLASLGSGGVTFHEMGIDPAIRRLPPTPDHHLPPTVLAVSEGGDFYARKSAKVEGIEVVAYATGRVVRAIEHPIEPAPERSYLDKVVLSPRGKHMVTVDRDNRLRVYPLDPERECITLYPGDPVRKDPVGRGIWWHERDPQISPDGSYLLAFDAPSDPHSHGVSRANEVGDIKVWELESMRLVRSIPNHLIPNGVCRFTDGGGLWVGSVVWSLPEPEKSPDSLPPLPGPVEAFHSSSGRVVMRRPLDVLAFIDWKTGKELFSVVGGTAFAFSLDGQRLAAFSDKESRTGIRVWDTATGQEILQSFPLDFGEADRPGSRKLTFSRDGRSLLLLSHNRVHIWDGSEFGKGASSPNQRLLPALWRLRPH